MATQSNAIVLSLDPVGTKSAIVEALPKILSSLPKSSRQIALELDAQATKNKIKSALDDLLKGYKIVNSDIGNQLKKQLDGVVPYSEKVANQISSNIGKLNAMLDNKNLNLVSSQFKDSRLGKDIDSFKTRVEGIKTAWQDVLDELNRTGQVSEGSIQKLTNAMGGIKVEFDEIKRRAANAPTELFKTAEATATKSIDKVKSDITDVAKMLDDATLADVKGEFGDSGLGKDIDEFRAKAEGVRSALEGVTEEVKQTGSASEASVNQAIQKYEALKVEFDEIKRRAANIPKALFEGTEAAPNDLITKALGTTGSLQKIVNSDIESQYPNSKYLDDIQGYKVRAQELLEQIGEISSGVKTATVADVKTILAGVEELKAGFNSAADAAKNAESSRLALEKVRSSADKTLQKIKNPDADPQAYKDLILLINQLSEALEKGGGNAEEAKTKLLELDHALSNAGAFEETGLMKFLKTFDSQVRNLISGAAIAKFSEGIRQIYVNVKDLNTELTQFKIVTGSSTEEIDQFADAALKSAENVASSAKDVTSAATVYARLGYSAEESLTLAEATLKYSKVAAVEVGDATSDITSILKAFDISADGVTDMLDKMTYVGRNSCPAA